MLASCCRKRHMTHLQEIGIKNRHQKTGTGFWRVSHTICYRIFLVSVSGNEQEDMLYFPAGLWYQLSGTGLQRPFLLRVSWT